jgi:CubicO group peptidase (beta-lactamase class C family)
MAMRGFGVTNTDDPQPVTADTIFTIASISKTVTATAMMRLVEQGRLDLKAPIRKYLPDFRVQSDTVSREVAVWHLLTHTPGWEGQLSDDDHGIESLAHFASTVMRDLPQIADPGTVWSYNNAGFALAGRVIEVVTGRGIHDALRELVFTPLGLTRTFTQLTDAAAYRMTLGHREQGGATRVIRPIQATSSTTAGGVMASVSDLLRYARFHLGSGAGADGKPWISRALLDEMRTPRVPKIGTDDEMGHGWHLRKLDGVQTAAHGGTLNGHCLLIELVPERALAFVILTNHSAGWRLIQDVEQLILKKYEGLALAPNQRIGHRGVNEAMTFHAKPLPAQPPAAEFAGTYRHPPLGAITVREDNGGLVIGQGNNPQGDTRLTFFGADVAYATSNGAAYEFIRKPDGAIGWIRVVGRIARKD